MAKQSGFPFTVEVDNATPTLTDISNDTLSHSFATPRGVQDVTGVNSSAMERILLLADFSGTLNLAWNPVGAHAVFATAPAGDVRTCALTIASQVLSNEVLATDYAHTRNQDGSLTASVPLVLANGTIPVWA